jgi:hypothetical protein
LSSPKLLLATRDKPITIPKPEPRQPPGIPENEELRKKIASVRQRHDSRAKLLQEKQNRDKPETQSTVESQQQKQPPIYDPFTVKYAYEVLSARPRPPRCDPANLEVVFRGE